MLLYKTPLLLHICCAPCSTHVIECLRVEHSVTGFFYNPNIHPEREYVRRAEAMKEYASRTGLPLLIAWYEPESWYARIRGLEGEPEGGARCPHCFRLRLERTAAYARSCGYSTFATTLSISPHKPTELINSLGAELSHLHGLSFCAADFKERGGFQRSVEMSKAMGLYRQSYCGCSFSRGGRRPDLFEGARPSLESPQRGASSARTPA